MVAGACNHSYLEGWEENHWIREGEVAGSWEWETPSQKQKQNQKQNKQKQGQVWWLIPVIPSTLGSRGRQSLKVKSSRPAWPIWWNPVSTRNTIKIYPGMVVHACNPSYLGGWGRRIAWNQKAEVAVNRDCGIALQPGQQEQNSVSKNKTKQKKQAWPTWQSPVSTKK